MENLKNKVDVIVALGRALIHDKLYELARRPGFYDFVNKQGGCDMVIIRDGKIVGSFAAAFQARSDPPGLFVPDLRDERAVKIVEQFEAREASILAAGVAFIMDETIDSADALIAGFVRNGIIPPE